MSEVNLVNFVSSPRASYILQLKIWKIWKIDRVCFNAGDCLVAGLLSGMLTNYGTSMCFARGMVSL